MFTSNSQTGLASFPDLISIQKREQKHNCWYRLEFRNWKDWLAKQCPHDVYVYIHGTVLYVNAESNRKRNCIFHSLGNPKGSTLDYFLWQLWAFVLKMFVITFPTNWYLHRLVSWNISEVINEKRQKYIYLLGRLQFTLTLQWCIGNLPFPLTPKWPIDSAKSDSTPSLSLDLTLLLLLLVW